MKKITDKETLKSIRGGVPAKKQTKIKIEDWITELSIAIEQYIGNVRESGVYRLVSKPYTVKELKHYDEANNESRQKFVVIDDVINMNSDNLETKYHLHAETEIDYIQDFANLHSSKINMSLDAVSLRKEVKQLQSNGYKVALYETQYSNHCLVAIKGKEIKYNLEQDFIKLNYENRESAKDFASKINELENEE